MSNYEFGGSLYRNSREMLDAIASAWLTPHGPDEMDEILAVTLDVELAREAVKGWKLDEPAEGWPEEPEAQSHMDECGYGTMDLADAFTRLRKALTAEV